MTSPVGQPVPVDPRDAERDQLRAELIVMASYCIRRYGDGEDDTEFSAGQFINKLLPWLEKRESALVVRLRAEVDTANAKVASYEDRITWDTTCEQCGNLLDKSYEDYHKIEDLRSVIAQVQALPDELAAICRAQRKGTSSSSSVVVNGVETFEPHPMPVSEWLRIRIEAALGGVVAERPQAEPDYGNVDSGEGEQIDPDDVAAAVPVQPTEDDDPNPEWMSQPVVIAARSSAVQPNPEPHMDPLCARWRGGSCTCDKPDCYCRRDRLSHKQGSAECVYAVAAVQPRTDKPKERR